MNSQLTHTTRPLILTLTLILSLFPSSVSAEGVTNVGAGQRLFAGTTLYVDIIDHITETFTWTGHTADESVNAVDPTIIYLNPDVDVSIRVTDPNGAVMGTYASGIPIDPAAANGNGTYTLEMDTVIDSFDILETYDVTVNNPSRSGGRLYSYNWVFDAADWTSSAATNTSFYAMVNGGSANYTPVVELKLEGLAGFVYQVTANDSGVDGANAGRSVDLDTNNDGDADDVNGDNVDDEIATPEFKIYLNPPAVASYSTITPVITSFTMKRTLTNGQVITDDCSAVVPGTTNSYFEFTSNVTGRYRITCDLNADGVFDISSDDDMTLRGDAAGGTNTVTWDGTDNNGNRIPAGTYDCQVAVSVGDFHYVARDIETAFPGMRMFGVSSSGGKTGLDMYWNDTDVQGTIGGSGAQDTVYFNCALLTGGTCPYDNYSLVTSGATGINSGTYTDTALPNGNSRAWGNFNDDGYSQGNLTLLDTYTFIESTESTTIEILAAEPTTDTDADGLYDIDELCTHGTDPYDCDTDDDCLCDGTEVNTTTTNPLDVDTDDDSVQDGTESGQGGPEGTGTDTSICIIDRDTATTTDPTIPDTDGDGCMDGPGTTGDFEDINYNGKRDTGERDPNHSDCFFVQGGGITSCNIAPPTLERELPTAVVATLLLLTSLVSLASLRRVLHKCHPAGSCREWWTAGPVCGDRFLLLILAPRPTTFGTAGQVKKRLPAPPAVHHVTSPDGVTPRVPAFVRKLLPFLLILILILFLWASPASALNVQILRPTPFLVKGYHLFTAEVPPPGSMAFGFNTSYARRPFEAATAGGGAPRLVGIVDTFVTSDFLFSWGIAKDMALNVDIPFNIYHDIAPTFIPTRDRGGADMGDPYINAKFGISERLAVVPFVTAPLGADSVYLGDRSVTGGMVVVVDLPIMSNLFYLNAGARFRVKDEQISNLGVGHEFLMGIGYTRPLVKKWKMDITVEGFASTTFRKFMSEEITTPLEGLIVVKKQCLGSKPFVLYAGGGTGVLAGYGTDDARALVGLSYIYTDKSHPICEPPRPKPAPAPPPKPLFIRLKEKVHFYTDKHRIMPRSFPTLDDVVKILNRHPEIVKVQVEGHTDWNASRKYNQGLSERRARSVYNYFVRKGITPQRLTWIGFGEDKPIAPNTTVKGRAKNRRTVLRILEVDYSLIPTDKKGKVLYETGAADFGHEEVLYKDY